MQCCTGSLCMPVVLSPFSSCNLTDCISYKSFKVLTSNFKVSISTTAIISWQKTKLLSSLYWVCLLVQLLRSLLCGSWHCFALSNHRFFFSCKYPEELCNQLNKTELFILKTQAKWCCVKSLHNRLMTFKFMLGKLMNRITIFRIWIQIILAVYVPIQYASSIIKSTIWNSSNVIC